MKLELKHLASYLPYGLKFRAKAEVWEMTCLYTLDEYKVWAHNYWDKDKLLYYPALNRKSDFQGKGYRLSQIKPILRPLSDLTKEIEHNGKKFVPFDRLSKFVGAVEPCDQIKKTFWITRSGNNDDGSILSFGALCKHIDQFELFQKVLEWHFDIYGLIEQGLAIDINTLEK